MHVSPDTEPATREASEVEKKQQEDIVNALDHSTAVSLRFCYSYSITC